MLIAKGKKIVSVTNEIDKLLGLAFYSLTKTANNLTFQIFK